MHTTINVLEGAVSAHTDAGAYPHHPAFPLVKAQIDDHTYVVGLRDGSLIRCAGLELHGGWALLRGSAGRLDGTHVRDLWVRLDAVSLLADGDS